MTRPGQVPPTGASAEGVDSPSASAASTASAEEAQVSPVFRSSTHVLRGRSAHIARALETLRSDPPISVAVVGEVGSGKTVLLQRLAEELGNDHLLISLRGSAVSARSDYATLGVLLTEVEQSALGHPFLVMDAIAEQLAERAEGRPVVVSIDNANLLDERSALVLCELARREVLSLLLSCVGISTLDPSLQVMLAEERLVRIDLQPLTLAEASLVLADDLGQQLSRLAAYRIWEASAGNPMYLRMISMGHLSDGRLVQRDGTWVIRDVPHLGTGSASDLAVARLQGMTAEHRYVADVMACVRVLPLPVLVKLAGWETVEELLTLRVLLVDQRSEPMVRLRHQLLGDIVRTDLPLVRRRRLYSDVSRALEGVDIPLPTRVGMIEWALQIAQPVTAEEALIAAEFALQTRDPERATRIIEDFPRQGADAQVVTVSIRLLCASGQPRRAAREVDAWLAGNHEMTDAEFVEFKIAEQGVFQNLPDGYARAGQALIDARERAGEDKKLLRKVETAEMELAAHQGHYADIIATHVGPNIDKLLSWCRRAVSDDTVVRGAFLAEALAHVGRNREARQLLNAVVAAAEAQDIDPLVLGDLASRQFHIHLAMSDMARCLELARRAFDNPSPRHVVDTATAEINEGLALTFMGHAEEAMDFIRPAIGQLSVDDHGNALLLAFAAGAAATARLGQRERAERYLQQARDYTSNAPWHVRVGAQSLSYGAAIHLRDNPEELVEKAIAAADRCVEKGQYQTALSYYLIALLAGGWQVCERIEPLRGEADGNMADLLFAVCDAVNAKDVDALLAAAKKARGIGLEPVVISLSEWVMSASWLEPTAQQRRRARRYFFDSQRRTASVSTLRLWLSQLSPTEWELAVGASEGASNAELGQSLHLSRRTVEWHMANIYEKLRVSNRRELTSMMSRAGAHRE